VAIVTGAGAGIGRACAVRYAAEGATVVVNALHHETADPVASQITQDGGAAVARVGDVSDSGFVNSMVDDAVSEFGRLDVMHNNAAAPIAGLVKDMTDDDWRRVMAVTLDGVFFGVRAALRVMVAQGSGSIINTTSSSGLAGAMRLAAYGAAKAAVTNLTRVAAVENARHGVRVNALCPGAVTTRGNDPFLQSFPGGMGAYEAQIPQHRVAQPEEIASVAAFLASDDASYVNGTTFIADGAVAARIALPLRPDPFEPEN
jgi:meso-butanediol dehydrogenase/(S,S)-butanediol dehydrogenase/diacetyl reductase